MSRSYRDRNGCTNPLPHPAHVRRGLFCAGVGAGSRSLDAGCIPLASSGAVGGDSAVVPGCMYTTEGGGVDATDTAGDAGSVGGSPMLVAVACDGADCQDVGRSVVEPPPISHAVSHQAASGAGVLLHAPPAVSSDGDFVLPCSCWASENESRCLIDADPSRFKVSS